MTRPLRLKGRTPRPVRIRPRLAQQMPGQPRDDTAVFARITLPGPTPSGPLCDSVEEQPVHPGSRALAVSRQGGGARGRR